MIIVLSIKPIVTSSICGGGSRGRDHMVVGFATTYALIVYHH